MKESLLHAHMQTAYNYAQCSNGIRLKVGAIIVKENRIISIGFNGTLPNDNNELEERIYVNSGDILGENQLFYDENGQVYTLKTKDTVIHAERNALDKITQSNESSVGATMFITHSPCKSCALSIANVGISAVYYSEEYRDNNGLDLLINRGISIKQIKLSAATVI